MPECPEIIIFGKLRNSSSNVEEYEILTLIITKSTYETLTVAKKIMKEWMKEDKTACIVDKHCKKMGITDNWECGVRTTGRHE